MYGESLLTRAKKLHLFDSGPYRHGDTEQCIQKKILERYLQCPFTIWYFSRNPWQLVQKNIMFDVLFDFLGTKLTPTT